MKLTKRAQLDAEDMFYNTENYFSERSIKYWTALCFHILMLIATRKADDPKN
jgi:hypothetical protein